MLVYAIIQCMIFSDPKYNSCVVDYTRGMFNDATTCQAIIDQMEDRSKWVNPAVTHYCASKTVQTWKKVD